ncbi:DUF4920 domain-containing protein [Flagellimonas myxillae]|uniref:DUF4920 domain-containing protein n=1 Tax=Flagellimonas myxillae TaxID=2942214 RepID=UPI00201EAEE9|nr:DUF4920 domain-containing protein [Muricauda myxillae]MCL6265207.1 DUF4920 domain-containing protein [Muricauda myxillae]
MSFFNKFTTILAMFFWVSLSAQESQKGIFYGKEFDIQPKASISNIQEDISVDEVVQTQLKGRIKEVCQAKGCWMNVTLDNQVVVFVRFKDYGFFVPTDSANHDVVLNGVVFMEEISIEDQKHYAKDRGDSPEEIAKITKPMRQLRFEAEGVLIH